MLVAEKLGIPFQTVDLSVEYKERIVDYMFKEYEEGRTPNSTMCFVIGKSSLMFS